MSTIAVPWMTTEDLLALPDDGFDRYLIRGELRERPTSLRAPRQSRTLGNMAMPLSTWRNRLPEPRGAVFADNVAVRLRRDPDTLVGIDLAYISAELAERVPENARHIDGHPLLAVEILSPSNTHEDIAEKVVEFLEAGVALVWVVDTILRTVTVYRPDGKPQILNEEDTLFGDPHLPGLRIPVVEIFRN